MKQFLEAIDYKITGGSEYQWRCFGDNARYLDSEGEERNTYSIHCIFDSVDQTIYSMEAWDYINDRCYRWIHPDYIKAYKKACKKMDIAFEEASDELTFVDLEVVEDFYEKASAMVKGEDYDTRVQVPVDFSDEDLLKYMKMAHDRDMTFNEFVEEALRHALEEVKEGRLTKEDARKFVEDQDDYSEI